jgi:hypothetical protein
LTLYTSTPANGLFLKESLAGNNKHSNDLRKGDLLEPVRILKGELCLRPAEKGLSRFKAGPEGKIVINDERAAISALLTNEPSNNQNSFAGANQETQFQSIDARAIVRTEPPGACVFSGAVSLTPTVSRHGNSYVRAFSLGGKDLGLFKIGRALPFRVKGVDVPNFLAAVLNLEKPNGECCAAAVTDLSFSVPVGSWMVDKKGTDSDPFYRLNHPYVALSKTKATQEPNLVVADGHIFGPVDKIRRKIVDLQAATTDSLVFLVQTDADTYIEIASASTTGARREVQRNAGSTKMILGPVRVEAKEGAYRIWYLSQYTDYKDKK